MVETIIYILIGIIIGCLILMGLECLWYSLKD